MKVTLTGYRLLLGCRKPAPTEEVARCALVP